MNYYTITHDDMLNGEGLRVVLWLSGCEHHCKNCHNPETWDINSGIKFNNEAKQEIFNELSKDYISGITFTGGDPLHKNNRAEVFKFISKIKRKFPNKTIWVYTGYAFEEILKWNLNISDIDVIVDGLFIDELKDTALHWIGSSNQRVINVKSSLKHNKIIEY